jgi:hypothetical protein
LVRRGYLRLLVAAGPRVRAIGAAHGIAGVRDLARLVARVRRREGDEWDRGSVTGSRAAGRAVRRARGRSRASPR